MRRTGLMVVAVLMISLLAVPAAHADGLMGKSYMSAGAGIMKPGDATVKAIDDSVLALAFTWQLRIDPHIDGAISYSHLHMDGTSGGSSYEDVDGTLTATILYHFSPRESYDPYISASFLRATTDPKLGGVSQGSTEDTGFGFEVGAELDMNEAFTIAPYIGYSDIADTTDTALGVSGIYWLSEQFALVGQLEFMTKDGDVLFGIAVALGI